VVAEECSGCTDSSDMVFANRLQNMVQHRRIDEIGIFLASLKCDLSYKVLEATRTNNYIICMSKSLVPLARPEVPNEEGI